MAYDDSLAERIRDSLRSTRGIVEKKLFGGIGFLLDGHIVVCVWKDSLIARLGPEQAEAALEEPHVRVFDVTGRPMKGWVMVEPDRLDTDAELQEWVNRAMRFVETLPPKE